MKWKKLKRIFNPSDHLLPFGCIDYAQSPQALVFDDYIRIYFSTRSRDTFNKYLSHIVYLDIDKNFNSIVRISKDIVIKLGNRGCFDEHGIFPMNVVRNYGKVYAFTCGWNRKVSVSVDTAIGLAVSDNDGVSFLKVGDGPVISSSLNEPFLVGDPFVFVVNKLFHMWYIFGVSWKTYVSGTPPDRIYRIGHAVSSDGINWIKDSRQIIDEKFPDESQALPTVIDINGIYHMFFCYRQSSDFRNNRERSYRIGYAYSYDMLHWVRNDELVGIDTTPGSWDSDMLCYPHVFRCDDKVYLLYNGNEFGRFGFGIAFLENDHGS